MKFGSHVNVLDLTRLEKFVPEPALRQAVIHVHTQRDNKREFNVKVETKAGMVLQSTFTVDMLVQLTNQSWIKSITQDNSAQLC